MRHKRVLAALVLLPFVAVSSVASAAPRGSDRNDGRTQTRASDRADAFWAYGKYGASAAPAPRVGPQRSCTYQGGPKSPWWVCR
jgi:hypothetical protein